MKKIAMMIIVMLSLLLAGVVYAEEVDQILKGLEQSYIVPVPAYAEEVNKETSQIMGSNCLITIYDTTLPFAEIAKFYRQRLGADGWQDISQDKNVMQSVKVDLFSDMLIFKKGDDVVNIQNLSIGGKTSFSVGRGRLAFSPEIQESQKLKVENYAQTKDIPVYPHASLDTLSTFNTSLGEQWGYMTSDSAETVLDFYRQNMLAKGWKIEREMPIAEQAYNPKDLENCPKCRKLQPQLDANTQTQLLNTSVKLGSLQFRKDGQVCTIAATEILSPGNNNTIVSVLYPEGK